MLHSFHRMKKSDPLRRLNEIEQLDPDPILDVGALEAMELVADNTEGLQLLVHRYSGSSSANVAGYLALLLSLKSSSITPETAPLVFEFADKHRRNDYDGALMSTVNAMTNQIGFGPGCGDAPAPPASLFPFLQHCLNYDGRRRALVHYAAVELLTTICAVNLLSTTFNRDQVGWLTNRIDELSSTDDVLLFEAIAAFKQCL